MDDFSLSDQIHASGKLKKYLLGSMVTSVVAGLFFAPAFIVTGLAGIGAIFMYMQESNYKVQEKIQQQAFAGKQNAVKHLYDMVPEVLYDPRKDNELMARISEPDSRNMKGGFRHDP
ncbi:MAG: hypothetical protein JRC55_01315 [Deltaproteobacteria bacterium]|nr:hypothetical protein [Deltaproteobacteria bacterium]